MTIFVDSQVDTLHRRTVQPSDFEVWIMVCPRCDGQGRVVDVRILATHEHVRLCDECDAMWPDGTDLSITNFVDFTTYVKPLGLQGLWSEIEVVAGTD